MIITTKILQYKDLLDYVSEETIAKYYLGIGVNKPFNSFFREDPIPSASLYYYHGRIYYNDFLKSMTLSDLLMYHKQWTYKDLLANIKQDFISNGATPARKLRVSKNKSTGNTILQVKYREWEDWDLIWWEQFNINKEILNKFDVKPIQYYWINGYLNVAEEYHYSYDFYWENNSFKRKLYAPYSKDRKWVGNGGKICQGEGVLSDKGELLIVTKSLKDVMCLYSLGYNAVAPPSESSFLPEEYFKKQKERFNKIIIFYDNDSTGILKAKEFSETYKLNYVHIPIELLGKGIKDISDYIKEYGKVKTKGFLLKFLKNLE